MSTRQSVTPSNPETAIYCNSDILLWDLKWRVLALVEYSWGSNCLNQTTQLCRKSWCSNKVTSTWACYSKACMWLPLAPVLIGIQLTLIFNPYKCRHASSNTLSFAAWSKQPQRVLQKDRGNCATALHHKTESTSKLPAVPLERFIHSQDRSCQPQAASLSHHINGSYLTGPQDGHLFARSLYGKTFMHRSE